jgi:acyl-CoA synthetase (AMP-forming)/AMP-acid ligase II
MTPLLNLGEVLSANARLFPDRAAASDLDRTMTFRQWNARACRLANALIGLGLGKGDRVAVLAYNAVEWLEIYAATAKAGLVMVPINFRLVGPEIAYIVGDSGATALIVQDALAPLIEEIRGKLEIPAHRLIHFGAARTRSGYAAYEALLEKARDTEPEARVAPTDTWALMYTSGTTGRPKGAVRSHAGSALLSLTTDIELGFSRRDTGLLVMPMCHANSLYFACALTYCGAAVRVYSRASFEAEHCLEALAEGPTFTSLVPTQYVMMLEIPQRVRQRLDTRRISKLMISSAPARRETKQAVMTFFPNSGLYELYGSTEAGWVTMLQPEEQLTRLGSVGRECVGTRPVRLIGEDGRDVPDGDVGELYSHTPYTFDGYWNLPEKTAEAFKDGYCSVGDMARRDADGFLHLVDRKSNMIISGGENIYPSEVEAVLGAHPAVRDVAIIGLPDAKWGERVQGVVVLKDGAAASEAELVEWCRPKLAGYKRPRAVAIIAAADMPKTATGKILHRLLRNKLLEKDPKS